jgi:hypothetical protein
MNSGGRLGLYAAGLVVAFAAVYAIAAAVVPDGLVADWSGSAPDEHAAPDDHAAAEDDGAHESSVAVTLPGVSLSAHGYVLSSVSAPTSLGEAGELSFQIADEQGEPLMAYENSHEKDLHLIVVRTDGSEYRHVHPTLNEHTGLWSTPWAWVEAGSYRMYADFVPAVDDAPGKVTLTRTIDVAGNVELAAVTETRTTVEVDGFEVSIGGSLVAGAASELTLSVSRAGVPVTTLQPYLGAFGHLVALRGGDLAYLHVHAEGQDPKPGDTAGPDITFFAEAPTAGRYLLYLDFKVDGQVRTAQFALDATQRS